MHTQGTENSVNMTIWSYTTKPTSDAQKDSNFTLRIEKVSQMLHLIFLGKKQKPRYFLEQRESKRGKKIY